jgi:hypothetical protein
VTLHALHGLTFPRPAQDDALRCDTRREAAEAALAALRAGVCRVARALAAPGCSIDDDDDGAHDAATDSALLQVRL